MMSCENSVRPQPRDRDRDRALQLVCNAKLELVDTIQRGRPCVEVITEHHSNASSVVLAWQRWNNHARRRPYKANVFPALRVVRSSMILTWTFQILSIRLLFNYSSQFYGESLSSKFYDEPLRTGTVGTMIFYYMSTFGTIEVFGST